MIANSRQFTRPAVSVLIACLLVAVAGISTARGASISTLYETVNPSVVVINTVERGRLKSDPEKESTEIGLGSGVIISADGLVLTAAHVIHIADAVEVKLLDGRIIDARILGTVNWADVGLLQLDHVPEDIAVADFGDSDKVNIGDNIFIIGAPRNLAHTLTVGYISGKRDSQYHQSSFGPEFLQTDAAINEGNSGGPMFDDTGKLIGIVSQYVSLPGRSEGLGLAIAINVARELLLEQRPFWLGAELHVVDGPLAAALNVPQPAGLLVQRVARHSPAASAGIRPGTLRIQLPTGPILIGGDVLLQVDGEPVTDSVVDFEERVRQMPNGHVIRFSVLRKGAVTSLYLPR